VAATLRPGRAAIGRVARRAAAVIPARRATSVARPRVMSLEAFGLGDQPVAATPVNGSTHTAVVASTPWTASTVRHPAVGPRQDRQQLLAVEDVTVAFGGLTAVNQVSLGVHAGEIVGLIGPNGAGKTTLFNAIAGLNRPARGAVLLFGTDATKLAVHERAALGVARTFQAIQLLPELTVFDNLMVATHADNRTGFVSHIVLTRRAVEAEWDSRRLVRRVIQMLGLGDVAHRPVSGLPFGTLRMVEVARALVTRAPLIMLDEPASGLDNSETERLSQLLFWLQAELGVTILLIEHDVKMVTSVCDYIYVIDRGSLIAEGTTEDIKTNPRVVAAYLGKADEPAPPLVDAGRVGGSA
jgi:branched-chain amino acid transport system ATP-binding protein